jgi:hypothetical protein
MICSYTVITFISYAKNIRKTRKSNNLKVILSDKTNCRKKKDANKSVMVTYTLYRLKDGLYGCFY